MLTERGKLFEEKEPSLSDDEVSAAYENGKIAASFRGKPLATSPENELRVFASLADAKARLD
jgi:hypothetical protein